MIDINLISESQIQDALDTILCRRPEVEEYQATEEAKYDLSNLQGTPQFRKLLNKNYYRYVDNLIPRVLSGVTDRLEVKEFKILDTTKTKEKNLTSLLKSINFDSLQKQVHRSALRDGSSFIVAEKQIDVVSVFVQTADMFEVIRDADNPSIIIGAVKIWNTDKGLRLNVYYQDTIERYYSDKVHEFGIKLNDFQPYNDGFGYIQKHGFKTVPVFAFVNNPNIRYKGVSELVSVLPIQKSLNTALINLLIAAEAWALPTRYLLGFQTEYDELGQVKPLKIENGGTWVFGDSEIKIGQLPSADLSNQLQVMNDLRVEMSRISGIPLHLLGLSSDYPSGESLKVAERSLVGKVEDRQCQFSDSWESLLALLTSSTKQQLSVEWYSAAPISEEEEQSIKLKEQTTLKQSLENLQTMIDSGLFTTEQINYFKDEILESI
jgi:hypothetical protein